MKISIAVATHKGNVRGNNEDNFYFSRSINKIEMNYFTYEVEYNTDDRVFFCVFDGIGGLNKGELASRCAMEQFRLYDEKKDDRPLTELLVEVNQYICGRMDGLFDKIGSTAVVVSMHNGFYEAANVGDSRCYMLREAKMMQLSEDHTQAALLRKIGINENVGTAAHNMNNVLTQYLGVPSEEFQIEPHISMGTIESNDVFLLCSDGLTNMVSDEEILRILSDEINLKDKRDFLLNKALENGGADNITMILIQVI